MFTFSFAFLAEVYFLLVFPMARRFDLIYFRPFIKMFILGTTLACALKLFQNLVALEKDEEQVNFINMRLRALWECPNQDEEVGMKQLANTKCFQPASREPICLLVGEPGSL